MSVNFDLKTAIFCHFVSIFQLALILILQRVNRESRNSRNQRLGVQTNEKTTNQKQKV